MYDFRPIDSAPHDETDVLLFGGHCHGARPPVVAAWFEKHTDVPGWYTYDDPDSPINMDPKFWMPLPEMPE